jgi:hypothetical protein
MKKIAIACVLGSVLLAVPVSAASVRIVNSSAWEIHHLYLSPSDTVNWGPDQLGDAIIASNSGDFTLTNIPADDYDIKIVDEDGDECVIEDVDIDAAHETWSITSKDLLACQSKSQ